MTPNWDLAQCVEGWQRAGLSGIGVTMGAIQSVGRRAAIEILASSGLTVASLQNLDPFNLVAPE
jgi:ribosomal protein S11